jgi:protein transport protein SEC24
MAQFHGNFFVRSTDLLAFPAIPLDQSYTVEVQIEENIITPFVVMQAGILYTTSFGKSKLVNVLLSSHFHHAYRGATCTRCDIGSSDYFKYF